MSGASAFITVDSGMREFATANAAFFSFKMTGSMFLLNSLFCVNVPPIPCVAQPFFQR